MKVLLICPIPVEFNACRSVFMLKDTLSDTKRRVARGTVESNEIFAVESGPTKARAAAETMAAIYQFRPDIVVDTGCCGGITRDSSIGEIIVGERCYEYDISGSGFPRRVIKEMKLPSAFSYLGSEPKRMLFSKMVEAGNMINLLVRRGTQLSGEFIIQSERIKRLLVALFDSRGCNWETAGVFISSLKYSIPPLSIRVVSDLADQNALYDFRRNARKVSLSLYGYIKNLVEVGWFDLFWKEWLTLGSSVVGALPRAVLP